MSLCISHSGELQHRPMDPVPDDTLLHSTSIPLAKIKCFVVVFRHRQISKFSIFKGKVHLLTTLTVSMSSTMGLSSSILGFLCNESPESI